MTILTIRMLEQRIKSFQKLLPRNCATNKQWSETDICRCMVKQLPERELNPSIPHDKIDLLHLLRRQYYSDIELAARLKASKLHEQTAQLRLVN